MKTPPYNTGKVKIGCHYVPPQLNYHTDITDQWQSVFIDGKREPNWGAWFYVMFVVGFAFGYWVLR